MTGATLQQLLNYSGRHGKPHWLQREGSGELVRIGDAVNGSRSLPDGDFKYLWLHSPDLSVHERLQYFCIEISPAKERRSDAAATVRSAKNHAASVAETRKHVEHHHEQEIAALRAARDEAARQREDSDRSRAVLQAQLDQAAAAAAAAAAEAAAEKRALSQEVTALRTARDEAARQREASDTLRAAAGRIGRAARDREGGGGGGGGGG